MPRAVFTSLVFCVALAVASPPCVAQGKTGVATVRLALDGVTLVEAVRWMARHTQRNFVVPDALRTRRITIVSGTPVTREEAYQGFLAALTAEGLTTERKGAFETIVALAAPAAPAPTPGSVDSSRRCPGTEGIQAAGDGEWTLTPAAFRALFSEGDCLSRSARILPYYEKGELLGIKIYGVRARSTFAALGLRNGDQVRWVGDVSMADLDAVLQLVSRAQAASPAPGDTIKVKLVRRGQQRVHLYRMVAEPTK